MSRLEGSCAQSCHYFHLGCHPSSHHQMGSAALQIVRWSLQHSDGDRSEVKRWKQCVLSGLGFCVGWFSSFPAFLKSVNEVEKSESRSELQLVGRSVWHWWWPEASHCSVSVPVPSVATVGEEKERRERRKEVLSEEVELNSTGIAQDIYRHFIA